MGGTIWRQAHHQGYLAMKMRLFLFSSLIVDLTQGNINLATSAVNIHGSPMLPPVHPGPDLTPAALSSAHSILGEFVTNAHCVLSIEMHL